MQKIFSLFLSLLLYYPAGAFIAYADDQPLTPIASPPTSSSTSTEGSDDGPVFHLSDQDMEKILKAGESTLKELKVEHRVQEQKQHVQSTEKTYDEGVSLYYQKRPAKAKEVLSNVEDSIADYKSTNKTLTLIDDQSAQKLRLEMNRTKQVQETPVVSDLSQKAMYLYQRTANLGDDKNIVILRDKIAKVAEVLKGLRQEKEKNLGQVTVEAYTQQQFDQIVQKADGFDQEIAKLVRAGNYAAAKEKFNEFQNTMADDLEKVKKSVSSQEEADNLEKNGSAVFNENGYKHVESDLLRQGIDLYRTRDYEEARIIFNELAYEGNRQAKAYLKKTDSLIKEEN
jgi:hypothetical protein